ncbi:hypothetical protein SAMN05192588_2822 [Nonlabens sp. Hel1_33_55]|nr:hypothetical protein SAMN05192588_2822 [Nonlabens sp. Hel1_33_55]
MTSLKLFIRFFDAVIIYMITVSVFWFYYFTLDTLGGEDPSDSFLNYFYIICAISSSATLSISFVFDSRVVKSSLLLISIMLIAYSVELLTQGASCRFYQYTGWISMFAYFTILCLSFILMIKVVLNYTKVLYISILPFIIVLIDFYYLFISFQIIDYLIYVLNLKLIIT